MRLLIAAVALILGGVPPILVLLPAAALVGFILKMCWIVSGIAALYLLYRWFSTGKKLIGEETMQETVAFWILVVSGINLGLVAFVGNIGMSISRNHVIFLAVALLYIYSAYVLWQHWKRNGGKMF